MKILTTYQCDHCNYTSSSQLEMVRHERDCKFNVCNKKCQTCIHFIKYVQGCEIKTDNTDFLLGKTVCRDYFTNISKNS